MLKNGAFNLAGSIANLLIGVAAIPLLIRFLGLENYGLWTLIVSVVGFVILAEAGLSTSVVVFVAAALNEKNQKSRDRKISNVLSVVFSFFVVVGLMLSAGIFLFLPDLVFNFVDVSEEMHIHVRLAFQFGALCVFIRLLLYALIGVEKAYQRFDIANIVNTTQFFCLNLGFVVLAFLGYQLDYMAAWWCLISFVELIVHTYLCRGLMQGIALKFKIRFSIIKKIFSYSSFVWGGVVAQNLFSQFDRIFVGIVLGPERLGIYSAMTGVVKNINTLSMSVVQPLLPEVSSTDDNKKATSRMYDSVNTAFRVNAFIAVSVGGVPLLFAGQILELIFGASQSKSIEISFIFLVAIYSAFSFNAVGYFVLLGLKKSRYVMLNIWTSVGIFLLMLWGFTHAFGLIGALLSNAGYLLTLLMVKEALPNLKISFSHYAKLVRFPIVWFVLTMIVSIASVFMIESLIVVVSIALVLYSCLVFWIYKNGMQSVLLGFAIRRRVNNG